MPDGGHQVDPGVLDRAAQTIRDTPKEQFQHTLPPLKDMQITKEDFGRKHGECFPPYKAGVDAMIACVESYLQASEDYANNLGGAGQQYAGNEEDSAAAMRNTGGA